MATIKEKLTPEMKKQQEELYHALQSAEGKFAQVITDFSGSMTFVYLHGLWFGFWILANSGLLQPYIHPFDPFPYGLLTMIVSLEAIFLSTFIMVAQNRQLLLDKYRDLEDEEEQQEEDKEQEELEQDVDTIHENVQDIQKDVDDIQKDLDSLIKGMTMIQQRMINLEKNRLGNMSHKIASEKK